MNTIHVVLTDHFFKQFCNRYVPQSNELTDKEIYRMLLSNAQTGDLYAEKIRVHPHKEKIISPLKDAILQIYEPSIYIPLTPDEGLKTNAFNENKLQYFAVTDYPANYDKMMLGYECTKVHIDWRRKPKKM